jgi:DNA polymerase elongation subunit (family B)
MGNNILFRGVVDGKRIKRKIPYSPSLYIETKKESTFKSLEGYPLEEKKFPTIKEARDYVKQFDGISSHKIYGNTSYEYAFIADQFKGTMEWDISKVLIAAIDIEVGSENGFPHPEEAKEPITAIAIKYFGGSMHVFGCGDYDLKGNEIYTKCVDEYDLCQKFLALWTKNCPDIITGWFSKSFDIPYIHNRFNKILGEDETKKLSPWGNIRTKEKNINGKKNVTYDIIGVASLDYIDLYKGYSKNGKSQENHKLDNIAFVELGESKLSYDEYDNLNALYRLNYQKFIEYNIKDTELVVQLDEKLGLIGLAMTLAYATKSNYEDVFAQTRMCDAMSYSYLLVRSTIVPPKSGNIKTEMFEGAYVKEVQVGMHEAVGSFDLDSLHPHLIMQYNISPETLIYPENYTPLMRKIISEGVTVEKMLAGAIDLSGLENATMTPNGQFFRTDKQGFLPAMLEEMYEDRKKFKKIMIQYKKDYENEIDKDKRKELAVKITLYDNTQNAKKLGMNSVYGALGSQYFRFFDVRLALAVTLGSQLSIRWVADRLNLYMNDVLKTNNIDFIIASDTDSVYLRLGELVKKVYSVDDVTDIDVHKMINFMDKVCESKIKPLIDKSFDELFVYTRAYQQKMQMKREALANKGIWTAKKRYILNVYNNEGVAYNEPEIKVMGLEMVKSSTPMKVRVTMKEMLKIIMNGKESDLHQFVKDFKSEFYKLPAEDISFPRGLNNLGKYSDALNLYKSGTPIHVRGAILYNHFLIKNGLDKKYELIKEGEKVKFIYLKLPNHFKDDIISFPVRLPKEFNLDKYIDYTKQFEKSFISPIEVILNCIGWKSKKVLTLESFTKKG